jgi:hypothetical protein
LSLIENSDEGDDDPHSAKSPKTTEDLSMWLNGANMLTLVERFVKLEEEGGYGEHRGLVLIDDDRLVLRLVSPLLMSRSIYRSDESASC